MNKETEKIINLLGKNDWFDNVFMFIVFIGIIHYKSKYNVINIYQNITLSIDIESI